MAAFNDNSDQRSQSEKEVSDATLASPKAGEQLQELLTILSELQLLKKSKKEPTGTARPPFLPSARYPKAGAKSRVAK